MGNYNTYLLIVSGDVSVLSPTTFSICDTSGAELGEFSGGGIVAQVKVGKTVTFVSMLIYC